MCDFSGNLLNIVLRDFVEYSEVGGLHVPVTGGLVSLNNILGGGGYAAGGIMHK
jgi:hypothetical protein